MRNLPLVGAGALALAFVPLRRVAQRVAKRAVPGADESAEYIARRKLQVYRAAVEGAMEDGEVTQKERAMLYRLAGELGLEPDEVAQIERSARDAGPPAIGAPTSPEAEAFA